MRWAADREYEDWGNGVSGRPACDLPAEPVRPQSRGKTEPACGAPFALGETEKRRLNTFSDFSTIITIPVGTIYRWCIACVTRLKTGAFWVNACRKSRTGYSSPMPMRTSVTELGLRRTCVIPCARENWSFGLTG